MESTAQSLVKTFSFYYMSLIYPHSLTTVEVQGSVDHQGTLMEQCTLVVYKLLNRGVFLIVHRTASFLTKKQTKIVTLTMRQHHVAQQPPTLTTVRFSATVSWKRIQILLHTLTQINGKPNKHPAGNKGIVKIVCQQANFKTLTVIRKFNFGLFRRYCGLYSSLSNSLSANSLWPTAQNELDRQI